MLKLSCTQSTIPICIFCVVLQRSHFLPLSLSLSWNPTMIGWVVLSVPGDGEFFCSLHALCVKHMHNNSAASHSVLRLCIQSSSQNWFAHLQDVFGQSKEPCEWATKVIHIKQFWNAKLGSHFFFFLSYQDGIAIFWKKVHIPRRKHRIGHEAANQVNTRAGFFKFWQYDV